MTRLTPKPILLTLAVAALVVTAGICSKGRAQTSGGPTSARFAFQSLGIKADEAVVVSVASTSAIPPPCRIRLFDADGTVAADSGEFRVTSMGIVHFTVNFAKLNISENRQGRKQFHVVVTVQRNPDDPNAPPDPCRPGVELVNARTGHTFGISDPPDPDFTF